MTVTAGGVALPSQTLTVNAGPIDGMEVSSVSVPLGSPETVNYGAFTSNAAAQTVSNVAAGTTYTFTIQAVDAQGNPTTSGASGQTATVVYGTDTITGRMKITLGSNGTETISVTTNSSCSGTAATNTVAITYGSGSAATTDTVTLG